MRIPQLALSEEESIELVTLLQESSGRDLPFARGVFAAVATSPTEFSPTAWFPLLLGDQVPDASTLKRMLALLMREYNVCVDCLALGTPAVPSPTDVTGVQAFAKGYVQVAQKDAAWTSNAAAFELTAPLMMLSGYLQAESMSGLDPNISKSPEEYLENKRVTLPDDLTALYEHFKEARVKQKAATPPQGEKVGRNDPCPCGSGKKFKKCCGA